MNIEDDYVEKKIEIDYQGRKKIKKEKIIFRDFELEERMKKESENKKNIDGLLNMKKLDL